MGSDVNIDISSGKTKADIDISTSKKTDIYDTSLDEDEDVDVVDEEENEDTNEEDSSLINPEEALEEGEEVNAEEAFSHVKEISHMKMRDISAVCLLYQYQKFLNKHIKNVDSNKEISSLCTKLCNMGYCSSNIFSLYKKRKNKVKQIPLLEDATVDDIVDNTLEVVQPEEMPEEIREVYEEACRVTKKYNKVINSYKTYLKKNMGTYFYNKTKDKLKFLLHPSFKDMF